MKRTVWVLIFLLSVCALRATAQANVNSECPEVFIVGPASIVKPGNPWVYTAGLRTNGRAYAAEYLWTVSHGKIVNGQGTTRVEVVHDQPEVGNLTVTVEVRGLPQGCLNTASESVAIDAAPSATKLDEFDSSLNSIPDDRFGKVVAAVQNNPNSQLFIFVPPIATIKSALAARFDSVIHERVDGPRITFIDAPVKSNLVQIWLVPPGATPPAKCEGCEPLAVPAMVTPAPSNCPTLEVTGPSGVTARGTIMPFVVLVSEPRLKNLSFAWTVSTGTIAEGQGTRVIKVRAPAPNGTKNITATVTVQGLPQGCRNMASDTAEIAQ